MNSVRASCFDREMNMHRLTDQPIVNVWKD